MLCSGRQRFKRLGAAAFRRLERIAVGGEQARAVLVGQHRRAMGIEVGRTEAADDSVRQVVRQRLRQLAGPRPPDGVTHPGLAEPEGAANLAFEQPQGVFVTKDFSYLSHEQSLVRHLAAPLKGAAKITGG